MEENIDQIQQPNEVTTTSGAKSIRIYKILKTGFMQHIWICMGMWSSVISPCVDVLRLPINCNYEQISRALASKSIGMIIGSVLGGIIADKLQRWIDVQMGISLVIGALSIGFLPWSPNLFVMVVAFFFNGFGIGSISAGGNAHALDMWGKDANAPFHWIHAGYGIGTIIGPLIVAPFLPSKYNSTHHHNNSLFEKMYDLNYVIHPLTAMENTVFFPATDGNVNSTNSTDIDVRIPFAITGSYTCLISIIFLLYAFFPLNKYRQQPDESISETNKTFKEMLNPGSCAGGDATYGLQMFLMIFLFYMLIVGKDCSVATFLQPVAVNTPSLQFSLKEADILITAFFICMTCGRFLVSFIGKWIQIQILIFVESIGIIAAVITLVVVGLNSKLNFWLTTCAFGLCTGPIYPSGMAWCDRYIKMTAMAFSILDIGIGCGAFLFSWLGGYLLNRYENNVVILFYVGLGCSVLALLLLIVMQLRGSLHGDRYKQAEHSVQMDDNEDHTEQLEHDRSPLIQ